MEASEWAGAGEHVAECRRNLPADRVAARRVSETDGHLAETEPQASLSERGPIEDDPADRGRRLYCVEIGVRVEKGDLPLGKQHMARTLPVTVSVFD
jgi:hypothetical protein